MSPWRKPAAALLLTWSCAAPAPPAPVVPPVALPCGLAIRYTPTPAPTTRQLPLPEPHLTRQPVRSGDAYTVWGASHYLRSPVHTDEVTHGEIALTGYIVETNFARAPRCAVHATGRADPEDCRAELPTFWLGDRLDSPLTDCIQVLGFAANYAQIHDAVLQFERSPAKEYVDQLWGIALPNPLPAAGAHVTVRGEYRTRFTKATTGFVVDNVMGLLTYASLEVHEPAPEPATLPGMKRRAH